MKILIRNSDNIVIYAQDDLILDTEAHGDNWRDPNFNAKNATLVDATLPRLWSGAVWSYLDGVWAVSDAARYAEMLGIAKAAFIRSIKSEAGALTAQVLQGLGSEYEIAEAEATAFKAAGYPATVPLSVADEVESKAAKGITITATVACNNILTSATEWRQAQAVLRRNRLTATSAAEVAVDAAELDVITANWYEFITAMRTTLEG